MTFSHIDANGNALMVDVGDKAVTKRRAEASGKIRMSESCFQAVRDGKAKKGDVLGVAQVAGIQASKRTSELIPLCHLLALSSSKVEFFLHEERLEIEARCMVTCEGKTGVEMEALAGVSAALLTIYDMCKAMDKFMEISGIHLAEKTGGKSGHIRYEDKEAQDD